MSGLSKDRIARLLSSNGVTFQRIGQQRKRMVLMSELERAMPDLVDSLRFWNEGKE